MDVCSTAKQDTLRHSPGIADVRRPAAEWYAPAWKQLRTMGSGQHTSSHHHGNFSHRRYFGHHCVCLVTRPRCAWQTAAPADALMYRGLYATNTIERSPSQNRHVAHFSSATEKVPCAVIPALSFSRMEAFGRRSEFRSLRVLWHPCMHFLPPASLVPCHGYPSPPLRHSVSLGHSCVSGPSPR